MAKTSGKNRVASGGTIHPIADAPVIPGMRFGDVLLSPGADYEWENGYRDADTGKWFRRDHVPLKPRRWSPLPGTIVNLHRRDE